MGLGEKIKQARLAAGLSQRQLCGEVITRNMLSLIENGSARPSMDTLAYFARQLGKPISFFLEEDAVTSPNQSIMIRARKAWADRNAPEVLTALEGYCTPDETFDQERSLLEYQALLALAQEALQAERTPYARQLLERAERCTGIYLADDSCLQLLRAKAGLSARLDCDERLLLKAEAALTAGERDRCLALLQAVEHSGAPLWQLLMGLCLFDEGDYAGAAAHLQKAEAAYPARVVPKLEVCYRELGDFRLAYEYACKQR